MRTAQPFQPLWEAKIGPLTRQGSGLLSNEVSTLKAGIDSLRVLCGGFSIEVAPKLGRIFADGSPVATVQPPCSLVWFRRMRVELGTHDLSHAAPECLWYGLGLESGGKVTGYRIAQDGKATLGDLT